MGCGIVEQLWQVEETWTWASGETLPLVRLVTLKVQSKDRLFVEYINNTIIDVKIYSALNLEATSVDIDRAQV